MCRLLAGNCFIFQWVLELNYLKGANSLLTGAVGSVAVLKLQGPWFDRKLCVIQVTACVVFHALFTHSVCSRKGCVI